MKRSQIVLILLFTSFALLGSDFPTPNKTSYVNDFANLLSAQEESSLDSKIRSFKEKTTIEMTVVTVEDLDGMEVADYTNRLANEWGVGRKDKNNGLVLLIAPNQRKWRIEVGYGLEPYLTDGYTKVKGESILKSNFKKKEYYAGIDLLLTDFMDYLGTGTMEERKAEKEKAEIEEAKAIENIQKVLTWFFIVLIILIVVGFVIHPIIKHIKRKEEEKAEMERRRIEKIRNDRERLRKKKDNLESLIQFRLNEIISFENKRKNYPFDLGLKIDDQLLPALRTYRQAGKDPSVTEVDIDKMMNDVNVQTNSLVFEIKEAEAIFDKYKQIESFINHSSSDMLKNSLNTALKRNETSKFKKNWNYHRITDEIKNIELVTNDLKNRFQNEVLDNKDRSSVKLKINEYALQFSNVQSKMDAVNNSINEITYHIHSMEEKEKFIKNNSDTLIKSLENDTKNICHSDVSITTVKSYNNIKERIKGFKSTDDVESTYNDLLGIMQSINNVSNMIKHDINEKENARENERRRIREQEEAERRRKREEEEEENRRRIRSYSSSYSSSSDYSSSSSSISSSSSDYGGGSFGGGGSDGSW